MLSDRDLLIRLDERSKAIQLTIAAFPGTFVTKDEFHPVKKIAFGFAGMILIAVVSLGIGYVLK